MGAYPDSMHVGVHMRRWEHRGTLSARVQNAKWNYSSEFEKIGSSEVFNKFKHQREYAAFYERFLYKDFLNQ